MSRQKIFAGEEDPDESWVFWTPPALVHFKMSPLCRGQDEARDLCALRSFYTGLVKAGPLCKNILPHRSSRIFWRFPVQCSTDAAQLSPLPRAQSGGLSHGKWWERNGRIEEAQMYVLGLLSARCVTLGELLSFRAPWSCVEGLVPLWQN